MTGGASIGGHKLTRGLTVRRTIPVVFLDVDVLTGDAHADEDFL